MLLCLTANHRNASFDLLEKLSGGAPGAVGDLVSASGSGDLAGTTTATHSVLAGAVVLATCNRFEAYLDVREDGADGSRNAVDAVLGAISSASAVDGVELRESVTVISHDDVVAHLFAVSSGLESVVIGEDEISGQVRRALEQARSAGTTTRGLEQLFQRASAASRQVKTTTAVGTAGRSLVRLALELASSRIIDWSETRVVMVGTGAYAGASLAALRDRGATDVTVFSPSGRAEKFAIGHGIRFTTDLAASIGESDVILTCTTAEGHVITPDLVDIGRRLLVIDLGLPRNVDPAVSQLENIGLLDLETISLHAPLEELNATSDARSIVGRAAREFAAAEAELTVAPAVVALRRHVTGILEAEIERARSRGDSSAQTEQALRHLAGVLMHTPSVRARELARVGEGADFSTAVATLFGLETAVAGDARADDEAAAS